MTSLFSMGRRATVDWSDGSPGPKNAEDMGVPWPSTFHTRRIPTMRWELKSTDVRVPEKLKERIDRRLRFSLSRFGDRVDRIVVFLRDLYGP